MDGQVSECQWKPGIEPRNRDSAALTWDCQPEPWVNPHLKSLVGRVPGRQVSRCKCPEGGKRAWLDSCAFLRASVVCTPLWLRDAPRPRGIRKVLCPTLNGFLILKEFFFCCCCYCVQFEYSFWSLRFPASVGVISPVGSLSFAAAWTLSECSDAPALLRGNDMVTLPSGSLSHSALRCHIGLLSGPILTWSMLQLCTCILGCGVLWRIT